MPFESHPWISAFCTQLGGYPADTPFCTSSSRYPGGRIYKFLSLFSRRKEAFDQDLVLKVAQKGIENSKNSFSISLILQVLLQG